MANPATRLATERAGRFARVLLVTQSIAVGFLDYYSYKQAGYGDPGAWNDLLAGRGAAPEQYRTGIVWTAHEIAIHLHTTLPRALGMLDGTSALVALLVLFRVLRTSEAYREAQAVTQWLSAAALILLVDWALAWRFWVQKPETLPAAAFTAVMLLLWQRNAFHNEEMRHAGLRGAALVILSFALATIRADIACLLNVGIFLFVLLHREAKLGLSRVAAMTTSAAGAIAAGGLQLYLMRVAYPQASYGNVKLWQLRPNLIHVTRWPPFVLFLLPFAWMCVMVWRRQFQKDAASVAFLWGTLLFMVLWLTIGKIDEVRTVMPLMLTLCPLASEMVMLEADGGPDTSLLSELDRQDRSKG